MDDSIRYFIEEMAKEAIELTCAVMVNILKYVPAFQGVDEAMSIKPHYSTFLPDHLKTKGMCDKAVRRDPWLLFDVLHHFKSQEMCKRVVEENPQVLKYVPDQFKIQKMCDDAVSNDPSSLQYIPDWLVTQKQIGRWYDDIEYLDDDEPDKWYNVYQKRKVQKAQIKEELMPIAWHPSKWWDWCLSEDEKKRNREIVGINMSPFVSGDQITKFFFERSIKFDPCMGSRV